MKNNQIIKKDGIKEDIACYAENNGTKLTKEDFDKESAYQRNERFKQILLFKCRPCERHFE